MPDMRKMWSGLDAVFGAAVIGWSGGEGEFVAAGGVFTREQSLRGLWCVLRPQFLKK